MNLVWFRNDLRVHDNPALWFAREGDEPAIAVFYLTPGQWRSHDWGDNKVGFILKNLAALKDELNKLGIPLLLRKVEGFADVAEDLLALCADNGVNALFYNRECPVDELERDRGVEQLLTNNGIECRRYYERTIIKPGSVLTQQGDMFRVFSPFKNAWLKAFAEKPAVCIPVPKAQSRAYLTRFENSPIPTALEPFQDSRVMAQWPAGEIEAERRLGTFLDGSVSHYVDRRDIPSVDGTSSLSPYLSLGVISVRRCFLGALEINRGDLYAGNQVSGWLSELIWREFYHHLLVAYPNLCKYRAFKPETEAIPWRNSEADFERWCEGKTGIPIVDAAMRQLQHRGWMHNRLRMVVAMFFTKNLLMDWRMGERYFMQQLVDGDLAANNGGWQWSASTGTDAAPYFRVFNPVSQSQKFDPDGEFIRRYVPELAALDKKKIHAPDAMESYPAPMVDLKQSRQRAIDVFRAL